MKWFRRIRIQDNIDQPPDLNERLRYHDKVPQVGCPHSMQDVGPEGWEADAHYTYRTEQCSWCGGEQQHVKSVDRPYAE